MKRVLVTGGTGFVGRHLVRSLAADGIEVHVPTRATSARRPALPAATLLHPLERPSVDVAELIARVEPDTVFHLATHFVARHRPAELADMVDSNVTLGTVVAEAAVAAGARLVHTTSAWQHHGGAEYDPVSLYAAMKQAFVDVVRYFAEVDGLDAREVCLFDTYGPDDDRHKLVDVLLDGAVTGATLDMSSGTQLVDLTHVSDVVAGLRVAAEHPGPVRGRFVLRSGAPVTVRALTDVVRDVTGRPLDVRWGTRPDRPREMREDWRVTSEPWDWSPELSLEAGLADVWAARDGGEDR
ncbi:NAD-dependent epimerase/dehydratase family protein [Cellulomonas shaoxiangyii]|uniref:NAD(P)-dependent oxidoreductase n=1 Tax=Cellulomonas shaoxiangyii TaxID=2566013 RepID=A0A4P7SK81_9CELL|nr:NAD(P)-dependent oxidoreductase [Cellulomonas shaoxiangyii]QCB93134.1 NAD(P)-dependent oxidoreductase [Cellulomonas shaoxiangyii]TGY84793.1 NAD(P)-dependent oxidoreductase [Cellulomonas shaoxiangyii]